MATRPLVTAVHKTAAHSFGKAAASEITLVAGLGVEGDAHCGARVQHRSRVAADPTQPNLRQVHLIHSELFEELALEGHAVTAGELGENITTRGLDVLGLPTGAVLKIGAQALVAIAGLRNPCKQIDDFQPGLLGKVVYKGPGGALVRKAGIMGVVVLGGVVRAGDEIEVAHPPGPAIPLDRV